MRYALTLSVFQMTKFPAVKLGSVIDQGVISVPLSHKNESKTYPYRTTTSDASE